MSNPNPTSGQGQEGGAGAGLDLSLRAGGATQGQTTAIVASPPLSSQPQGGARRRTQTSNVSQDDQDEETFVQALGDAQEQVYGNWPPGDPRSRSSSQVQSDISNGQRSKEETDGYDEADSDEANVALMRDSFNKLSTEEKNRFLRDAVAEQSQEQFPTFKIVEESDAVKDALTDNEDKKQLLTHSLQTVQESKDDVKRAAQLLLKGVQMSEQELIMAKQIQEINKLKTKLNRANVELSRIKDGEFSDPEAIGEKIYKSRKLTGRITKSAEPPKEPEKTKKPKTDAEVSAGDEIENENVFPETSETSGADSDLPVTPPPVIKTKAKKTKGEKQKPKSVKFEANTPEVEEKTPAAEENDDNFSVFSNSNSLLGCSKQQGIYVKLKVAFNNAEETLKNESKSAVHLKDAKEECKDAIKYYERMAPSLESISVQESEEIEAMKQNLRNVVKKLNSKLESAEERKEQKKKAPNAIIPEFNCYASGFLQWRKEFRQATKDLTDTQRVTAARKAIKPRSEDEKKELNQLFSNCASFKNLDKALINKWGDISVLLPAQEQQLDNLMKHPKFVEDEQRNIGAILEFYRLCVAHGQEHKFDETKYRKTRKNLRKHRQHNLNDVPLKTEPIVVNKKKPDSDVDSDDDSDEEEDQAAPKVKIVISDYIARLERYQSENYPDIMAYAKKKEGSFKHNNHNNHNNDNRARSGDQRGRGSHTFQVSTEPSSELKCFICGKNHRVNRCPVLLNPKKTKEERKNLLNQKQLCLACLFPKGSNHKTDCYMWKNKHTGKMSDGRCKKCNSGMKFYLCCSFEKYNPDSKDTDAPKLVPVTENAATKVEMYNAEDEEDDVLMVNGVPLGAALGNAEQFTVTDTEGVEHELTGIHDEWSKSTLFDPSVIHLMTNKSKSIYNISTVNSCEKIDGGKGTLSVKKENKDVPVEGLVVPLNDKYVERTKVKMPSEWRAKYNLPEEIRSVSGKIHVIFGLDMIGKGLSPKLLEQHKGVKLSVSGISGKPIISGYDEELMSYDKNPVNSASDTFFVSTHRAEAADLHQIDKTMLELLNPSAFHTTKLNLCDKCVSKGQCPDCKFQLQVKSPEERQEEKLLSESCSYNKEEKVWIANPPLKREIEKLPTYKNETLKDMKRLQSRLRRDPDGKDIAAELDKAVFDNIESGKYCYEEDLLKKNPEFSELQEAFCPQGYVFKDSKSTRVRMTHNFSYSRGGGISYNSCQLKGSSLNNKLFYLVLQNRGYKYNIQMDIKRFYTNIRTSPRISSLQKMWWPKGGILNDDEFEVIVCCCLVFGSVHSQCLSNICKLKTGDMFIEPVSEEANGILKASYTDDINAQSNISLDDAWRLAKIIQTGLREGHFEIKEFISSHTWDPGGTLPSQASPPPSSGQDQEIEPDAELKSHVNSKAVPVPGTTSSYGMLWLPQLDVYKLKISINMGKKKRGKKHEDLQIESIEDFRKYVEENGLTKRQNLSLCHQIFDILNLFYAVKCQLHLLYRNLIIRQPHLNYDDKIDQSLHEDWIAAVKLILDLESLTVPRSAIPLSWNIGDYISLVVYMDGSQEMSISKAFVRVATNKEMTEFDANFLQASFKMGYLGPNSAVKTEFHSLSLATRQIQLILSCWKHIQFSEIFLLSDSKVCLGALHSFHARLKLFYAEKVLESQAVLKENKVKTFYIPSKFNLANDGGKRELNKNFCLEEKYWKGDILHLPVSDWPIEKYEFNEKDSDILNSGKMNQITSFAVNISEHFLSKLVNKSYSFDKITRIVCYTKIALRKIFRKFNKNSKLEDVDIPDLFDDVQNQLYTLAKPTREQCSGLERQFIISENEDKSLFLITRAYALDQKILQEKKIIINGKSLMGQKITSKFHIHMSSVETELAKISDAGLYILKGRCLLKKISLSCVICKKLRKISLEARMGPSYQKLSSQYPIGYYSMVDLVGPAKLSINRRNMKFYLFTSCCLWSRVFQVLPLFKIDSNSILTCIKSCAYLNNGLLPRYVMSDFGRQITTLQSLNNEEKERIKLETQDLNKVLSENRIQLVLSSPLSPHRQSLIERMHRELKRTLKRANLFNNVFRFHEVYHMCHYLSFHLNSRPLNIRFSSSSLITLTPNKLLRGNVQNFVSQERMNINLDGHRLYERLDSLEKQLKAWFALWTNTYLEKTKQITKWTSDSPQKLKIGSIVMIKDHFNSENGYNTIGQIYAILSPRTYEISYVKIPSKLNKKNEIIKDAVIDTLTRPIQSIIYLCEPEENITFNLDPFYQEDQENVPVENISPTQADSTQQDNVPVSPLPEDSIQPALNEEESLIASQVVNNLQSPVDHPPENIEDVTDKEIDLPKESDEEVSSNRGTVNTLMKFIPDDNVDKMVEVPTLRRSKRIMKKPTKK